MERKAVWEMYHTSPRYGLMYKFFLSDGDSKSYLDIWDDRGVCEHCQKKKDLLTKRTSKEFEEWFGRDDYQRWIENRDDSLLS